MISSLMYKIIIYLHIIHLLKSSTCFEHFSAHLQEVYVVIVYIRSLWYRHSLQVTVLCTGEQDSYLQGVTIPEAAYIQLRRTLPEDEQGNALNMRGILINVLYVNKKEFCASSWRSARVIL